MKEPTKQEIQYAVVEMFSVVDRLAQAHFNSAFNSDDESLIDAARESEALNREIQRKVRTDPFCTLTGEEKIRLKSLIDIFFNATTSYCSLLDDSIINASPVHKNAQIIKFYSYKI